MGLFNLKKAEEPTIKTLNDLFSFKFDQMPDNTFILSKQMNSEGIEVATYRKILAKKECGMFDTLEVMKISPTAKNLVFSTTEINKITITDVKKLVDTIFLFLGADDDFKGRFDNEDKEQFQRGMFWSRMWLDPKHSTNIMISLNPPTFEMSLLGIDRL